MVDAAANEPKPMTESHFNMWRAMVALAHADHKVTTEEREFMRKKFDGLNFTEEQKEQLHAELDDAQDVIPLFEKITDKRDRAEFIYFARLLFWSDGEFELQEEEILKHLHESTISKVDLEAAMHEVDKQVDAAMAKYDAERELAEDIDEGKQSWFYRLISGFDWLD